MWYQDVMWQNKNVIFPFPQDLYASTLAQWWRRVRGSHPQSHKSYSSHGHIMPRDKLKTFVSTSTISINKNLGRVLTQGEGLALTKSHVPLIIWSSDATWQNKSVCHLHRTHKHQTWHSGNLGWGATTHNMTLDHVITWCLITKLNSTFHLLFHKT